MSSLLICVGVDHYDHLRSLRGAERDAIRVFEILTHSGTGAYEEKRSILLRSPRVPEFRSALLKKIRGNHNLDTLTFYFAGHGAVVASSYYLLFRDAEPALIAGSSLSVSDLFRVINEIVPSQANIIMDACQAGGVVADLHALLKPDVIGAHGTTSVTILAASAQDQFAAEGEEGGTFTRQMLRYLRGEGLIQVGRPFLDLVEVGRAISNDVQAASPEQTPVVWGLNLYGDPGFARNPCYDPDAVISVHQLAPLPLSHEGRQRIRECAPDIWPVFYKVHEHFDARALVALLERLCAGLEQRDTTGATVVEGLVRTLADRGNASPDMFRETEVISTGIVALLKHLSDRPVDAMTVRRMLVEVLRKAHQQLAACYDLLSPDRYALLSSRGGFADFFFLPLRISKILGWIGVVGFLSENLKEDLSADSADVLRGLANLITDRYAGSIVAVAEAQTPYLFIYLRWCEYAGWTEEAELVFGLMFTDLVENNGKIAGYHMEGDEIVSYLFHRASKEYSRTYDVFAHPVEMVAVLLYFAARFDLAPQVDPYLQRLDHLAFNIFVPDRLFDFGELSVRDGVNITYQIGHGVWTIHDFWQRWESVCVPRVRAAGGSGGTEARCAAVLASVLFPDRVAWFIAPSEAWGDEPTSSLDIA